MVLDKSERAQGPIYIIMVNILAYLFLCTAYNNNHEREHAIERFAFSWSLKQT